MDWLMDNMMKVIIVFVILLTIVVILFSVDVLIHTPAPSVSTMVVDKLSAPGQDSHTSVGVMPNGNGGVSPVILTNGGSSPKWQFVVKMKGKYQTVDTTETRYYTTNIGDTVKLTCYYGVIFHDYNCIAGD